MAVITTIRSAFGFLTRLPVGPWPLQNDLNGISAWLPLVGLVVGGLAGGLTWAATLLFPSLVCGVIGCARAACIWTEWRTAGTDCPWKCRGNAGWKS